MRFVSGTWYGAGAVARAITRGRGADPVPVSAPARAEVIL
jgi:hypothetical protein